MKKNLNKIIDVNYYPVEEARRSNMRHRPIGIGVQGLADVFILLRMAFDSDGARELNKDIFETIYKIHTIEANPEITIEANPDDLDEETILQYANSPINRLSIGVQSFFEDDLLLMNRAHNSAEAKKCLEFATQHFDNISIDLIYGMPNMSNEKYRPPTSTLTDAVHSLGTASIATVPVVGNVAAEIFKMIVSPPIELRRQEWMERNSAN